MRRSDREIVDHRELLDVLNRCDVIRLGLNTPDYPYIVPMNFGFESYERSVTLWFHCTTEGGIKLDNIRRDNRAGFEADCSHKLIPGDNACSYTMEYESVIGCGSIYVCNAKDEKLRGLNAIIRHYEPDKTFDIPEAALNAVCVLRLEVLQITGKRLMK